VGVVVGFGRVYRRCGRTIPFFGALWSVSLLGWGLSSSGHGGGKRAGGLVLFKYLCLKVNSISLYCASGENDG
jgi:hypothetical protein